MNLPKPENWQEVAENSDFFEQNIIPHLQELKRFAQHRHHAPDEFESDWQDALIFLWQEAHNCPKTNTTDWAQQLIASLFRTRHYQRIKATKKKKSCELDETKHCSTEEATPDIASYRETEGITNIVSCVENAKLAHLLLQMPPNWQEVVGMRCEGYATKEIAQSLHLTTTAVDSRYARAIRQLRAHMGLPLSSRVPRSAQPHHAQPLHSHAQSLHNHAQSLHNCAQLLPMDEQSPLPFPPALPTRCASAPTALSPHPMVLPFLPNSAAEPQRHGQEEALKNVEEPPKHPEKAVRNAEEAPRNVEESPKEPKAPLKSGKHSREKQRAPQCFLQEYLTNTEESLTKAEDPLKSKKHPREKQRAPQCFLQDDNHDAPKHD